MMTAVEAEAGFTERRAVEMAVDEKLGRMSKELFVA
jgi:hypothetical protein